MKTTQERVASILAKAEVATQEEKNKKQIATTNRPAAQSSSKKTIIILLSTLGSVAAAIILFIFLPSLFFSRNESAKMDTASIEKTEAVEASKEELGEVFDGDVEDAKENSGNKDSQTNSFFNIKKQEKVDSHPSVQYYEVELTNTNELVHIYQAPNQLDEKFSQAEQFQNAWEEYPFPSYKLYVYTSKDETFYFRAEKENFYLAGQSKASQESVLMFLKQYLLTQ